MPPDQAAFGLSRNDLTAIITLLKSFPSIERGVIFGSRALGTFKPGSDVDIALFGQIEEETILAISYALNEELALPYFFDILAYDTITSPDLKNHIERVGVVFYSIN